MLQYIRERLNEYLDDFAYQGKHSVKHVLGKSGIKGGARLAADLAVGTAAEQVAGRASVEIAEKLVSQESASGLKVLAKKAVTMASEHSNVNFLIAAPLLSGFGVLMENEEYHHKRAQILNHYRPEIASWLDKKPDKLTQNDLDAAAYGDPSRNIPGNGTLRNALEQMHKEHKWNTGIGVVSNVAAALATTRAVVDEYVDKSAEGIVHKLGEQLGASSALSGDMGGMLAGGIGLVALGALSYAVYVAVKTPLHWLAEKAFGVESETAVDRIQNIRSAHEDGKSTTAKNILKVYIAANPELDNQIKAEHGKKFSRLNKEKQNEVLATLDPQLGLSALAKDINEGRLRPEELAFAVEGQSSGVAQSPATAMPPPQKLIVKAWNKCVECAGAVRSSLHLRRAAQIPATQPDASAAPPEPKMVTVSMAAPDGSASLIAQAYNDSKPGQEVSYVKMVGERRGKDGNMSFREFVDQSRSVVELGA